MWKLEFQSKRTLFYASSENCNTLLRGRNTAWEKFQKCIAFKFFSEVSTQMTFFKNKVFSINKTESSSVLAAGQG